jgi:hypothetical protein
MFTLSSLLQLGEIHVYMYQEDVTYISGYNPLEIFKCVGGERKLKYKLNTFCHTMFGSKNEVQSALSPKIL